MGNAVEGPVGLALVAALIAGAAIARGGVGRDERVASQRPAAGDGSDGEEAVIELTNGAIVLGVLPPLGGRAVVLRTAEGKNLLDSDPKYRRPPFPEASLGQPFLPWNGRIVWTGPQSGFWSQQDLAPDRRGAGWPPDPFGETARFEVVERTPTRAVLQGPVSPVTGLSLRHEYEIVGERIVRMRVTGTNGRDTPVSWDLWPNTRVRPDGYPYVPIDPEHPPRIEGPPPGSGPVGPYPHEVHDGWLAMPPGHRPESPDHRLSAKAFVSPPRGLVAFFRDHRLLLIRADVVSPARLHPEQAFVEVYRGAGATPADDILELEMHGPYETLGPGESMSFEQTFEIQAYDGSADVTAHLARLDRVAR
jgi:hypothetical protein